MMTETLSTSGSNFRFPQEKKGGSSAGAKETDGSFTAGTISSFILKPVECETQKHST